MDKKALIYYSHKYNGEYNLILKAIYNKEPYECLDINNCFTIYDDIYPKEFLKLNKPPLVIYYYGNLSLLKKAKIAIVGSRDVDEVASVLTKKITEILSKKYIIVSGMAKGVDAIAHENSLLNGTIAILGSGIDYIYPKVNEALYKKICKNGLIISEYPNKAKPLASHFPFRNRLIAALGNKLIVTCAKTRSGTFTTVNEALELNKDVYVLPYRYDDYNSIGSNELIEEGANIITINNINFI